MTVKALALILAVLWSLFAVITYVLPPNHVFHFLNAWALAASAITISAYWPGVIEIWRRRADGITPAHLLTFGVVTNWTGLTVRLGRWYVTAHEPATDLSQWAYNVGLWVSICAAFCLIGVVALAEPRWTAKQFWWHIAAFVLLTWFLWTCDYLFP